MQTYGPSTQPSIPSSKDLPVPKPPPEAGPTLDEMRMTRLQLMAPHNLVDPHHELDHFYGALLKGGTVRILHYGDSPTTGDLITADARVMFQKQFGDAGAGFVLIAKPWAWYNHRGVDMDSPHWAIDVAGGKTGSEDTACMDWAGELPGADRELPRPDR